MRTVRTAGTVLVVDDDRAIREMLRVALESAGYLVWTLQDGQHVAETLLTACEPCVVLLDLMMPQVDGYEVCRMLAADARFARHAIVVMTASELTANRCPAPARKVLPKPFTLDQLYTVVESLQTTRMLTC